MKKIALACVIGAVAGIPLTAMLGPVGAAITIFLVSFVISASSGDGKAKKKSQPRNKITQEDEDLITAILPVINSKN